eukprot:TRINITY_DN38460_c0_g1_i1.p1 TRINITY_DN38460_c0_g1~~TRINITY_DN38460_c0_g1_i1.p1  ORF type:complete len:117 (-),score=30.17 TRINITY_DN38460_c0_g1_i1:55-405(-)
MKEHSVVFILLFCASSALVEDDVPECEPGDFILPNSDDCTGFYKCTAEGVAVAYDCPPGLYFDPSLQICNWPENVDCIDDSPETLECMEGMTACILSSEEDEGGDKGVDLHEIRRN